MDSQILFRPGSGAGDRDLTPAGSAQWDYRPASDLTLGFHERNRSLDCERGMARRFVQAGTWAVVRKYLHLAHHLRVSGSQNLPARGPFVMVANHSSHLDALSLAAAVPARRATDVTLLAAGDTFFTSRTRSALASIVLNARPVWRGACGSKALGTLRNHLQESAGRSRGPIMVLFPEGTRSRTGQIARFKAGVGTLVAGTTIPVVPVCLTGAHDAWPAGQDLPCWGPISLSIGRPVTFEGQPNQRSGWRLIASELEERVRGLSDSARWKQDFYPGPQSVHYPLTSS